MVAMKLNIFLLINILCLTDCERRIKDGKLVTKDKRYVVYLVKAPISDKIYDEWLCGGALVSTMFIITSAACVTDVEFMYAIAGYKKYVTDADIEMDECTRFMKKKVVYTCVPLKYELNYEKVEKWSFIDIALVKVESPWNLDDHLFLSLCSYKPTVIPVNYEPRFQTPGTDALVYGWGHLDTWRKPEDTNFYNQENIQYASTKIMDKPTCKKHYEMYNNMSDIIDQYMICALSQGEINDQGELVLVDGPSPKLEGCNKSPHPPHALLNAETEQTTKRNVPVNETCDDYELLPDFLIDDTRRGNKKSNQTSSDTLQNGTAYNRTYGNARKYGICQNDHGGPLVTWVGGKEILIGVASVFKVSDDSKCMGPYLYTSTQCNGAFLDCILSNSNLPETMKGRSADNEKDVPVQTKYLQSEQLKKLKQLEGLIRFAMLAKLAKDQTAAVLRQSHNN